MEGMTSPYLTFPQNAGENPSKLVLTNIIFGPNMCSFLFYKADFWLSLSTSSFISEECVEKMMTNLKKACQSSYASSQGKWIRGQEAKRYCKEMGP